MVTEGLTNANLFSTVGVAFDMSDHPAFPGIPPHLSPPVEH